MPYCPRCGVENPASARFCDQCGATLIPVTTSAPAPVVRPQPTVQPAPAPQTASVPVTAGPITCPQCGTRAIAGEAFCDNCGAPLSAPAPVAAPTPAPTYSPGLAPQPTYPPTQPAAQLPASQPASLSPTPAAPTRTSLAPAQLVFDDNRVLPLPHGVEAVIGRADPVSNYAPEIDLGPHGALEHGVGRRQARFFLEQGQIKLEDLDSTNGTLVNGQRLAPRQPQPLQHNDTVQFGKLRLRFHQ